MSYEMILKVELDDYDKCTGCPALRIPKKNLYMCSMGFYPDDVTKKEPLRSLECRRLNREVTQMFHS